MREQYRLFQGIGSDYRRSEGHEHLSASRYSSCQRVPDGSVSHLILKSVIESQFEKISLSWSPVTESNRRPSPYHACRIRPIASHCVGLPEVGEDFGVWVRRTTSGVAWGHCHLPCHWLNPVRALTQYLTATVARHNKPERAPGAGCVSRSPQAPGSAAIGRPTMSLTFEASAYPRRSRRRTPRLPA